VGSNPNLERVVTVSRHLDLPVPVVSDGYLFSLLVQFYHHRLKCPVSYVHYEPRLEAAIKRDVEELSVLESGRRLVVIDSAQPSFVRELHPLTGVYVVAEVVSDGQLVPEAYNGGSRRALFRVLIEVLELKYHPSDLVSVSWEEMDGFYEIESVLRTAKAGGWSIDQLKLGLKKLPYPKFFSDPKEAFLQIPQRGVGSMLPMFLSSLVKIATYKMRRAVGSVRDLESLSPQERYVYVEIDREASHVSMDTVLIIAKRAVMAGLRYSPSLVFDWLMLSVRDL
jgi:hypothetical protein